MEIKEIVAGLTKPLPIEQIDWRVQSIKKTKNGKVGMIVLGYKDSRVDMQRLDEVCGGAWQNEFMRDSKGVLQCGISVYAQMPDKEYQWVTKFSNGVESFAEKEKGEYSDAFKRAGFMWGIGRELYDLPFIWIDLNNGEYYEYKGGYRNSLNPNDLIWSRDNGLLVAKDSSGTVRFKERKTQNTQAKTNDVKDNSNTSKGNSKTSTKPITDKVIENVKKGISEKKVKKDFEEVKKMLIDLGFEEITKEQFGKL